MTNTTDNRSRIILDCDPGYDDAVAIMLAAGSPKIEVLAITTVAGNQSIEKVTKNALRLAAAAGLTTIPVAQGARRPLLKEVKVCPEIHGETGLDGTSLSDAYNAEQLDDRPAAQLIVDIIMREPPKTVTLVPTGPLTNIALAVRLEPRIVERVKEVVLMGGGVGIGNVKPYAEFNIENDPEAAAIVFGEPWKVVMVGLDLTYQARAAQRSSPFCTPASAAGLCDLEIVYLSIDRAGGADLFDFSEWRGCRRQLAAYKRPAPMRL